MVNLKDLRDSKKKYMEEKDDILNGVGVYVKDNLKQIKDLLEIYRRVPVKLKLNWVEKVSLTRLSSWIKQIKKIINSKIKMENLDESNERNIDDLYEALAVYNIIQGKICQDVMKIDGLYIVECRLNLSTGDIQYYELNKIRHFRSHLVTDTHPNINNNLVNPYILKVGNEDLYFEIFNVKIEETLRYFIEIESFKDYDIKKLLLYRFIHRNKTLPFISKEELIDDNYEALLNEHLSLYTQSLYSKDFSMKKKSYIVNLLALGFPHMVGTFDISYFKDTRVYYSLYWILNNEE